MSDQPPSRLKLPSRTVPAATPATPPTDQPGLKLPIRPREPNAADEPDLLPVITLPGNRPEKPDRQGVPVGFKFQNERIRRRQRHRLYLGWGQVGIALGTLIIGFLLGQRHGRSVPPTVPAPGLHPAPTTAEQAEINAAFTALKSARSAEARAMFSSLVQTHPRWTTLNADVALAILSAHDASGFNRFVQQGESSGVISPAAGGLLLSQLAVAVGQYAEADRFLAESAGADPAKPETYYAWGECFLRWGKPNAAVEKFRAARSCNLYPAADSIYATKLWLAEVESGLEATDGSREQIDQALAAEQPTSPALFAKAARAIKAGDFTRAADDLVAARRVADPTMFRLVLQDPYFYAEHWRSQFAAIYREAFKTAPPPGPFAATPSATGP